MDSKIKRKHVTADPDEPNDLISSSQTDLYADVIPNLHPRSSRRTLLKTGLGLAVVATGAGTWLGLHREVTSAKQQTDNVVIQWNSAALQAIGNTATGPTIGARALAITHTSMYDAWSVYDATAIATRPNGIPRQKSKWKDETEAVCYAAYRALMDLFPSQSSVFNAVMSNQGYDPNDTSTDTTTPSGVGNVAAQAVLSYRHSDGANQLNSTFSAAGAYILTKVTGLDIFGDSYIAAPGSSAIEPGITPSTIVPLLWPTFSSAAVQAGMSRRYGGIHFQQADEDGRTLGYNVAPQAWIKAQSYIQGTV